MNKKYLFSLIMLVMMSIANVSAQEGEKSGWFFGLGYNFVDDSGKEGEGLFNFDSWTSNYYPNRLSVGYELGNSGFSIEGVGTINKVNRYYSDKVGEVGTEDGWVEDVPYWAADLLATYGINKFFTNQSWFDPYLLVGTGISSFDNDQIFTFDAGAGINFWLGENFALNINTMGKWGLGDNSSDNHVQSAIGVVFRPGIFKKKPEPVVVVEEEVVVEEVVEEVVVEEEVIVVEEPVVSEEELLRQKREKMEAELNEVDDVFYNFDSANLTEADVKAVDELIAFMNKYPSAKLEIQGNTDQIGPEDYNLKLSEKRANAVVDYAVSKGIDKSRLTAVGYGETKITNGCINDKPCTREQNAVNRVTDYKLIW